MEKPPISALIWKLIKKPPSNPEFHFSSHLGCLQDEILGKETENVLQDFGRKIVDICLNVVDTATRLHVASWTPSLCLQASFAGLLKIPGKTTLVMLAEQNCPNVMPGHSRKLNPSKERIFCLDQVWKSWRINNIAVKGSDCLYNIFEGRPSEEMLMVKLML